MSRDSDARRNAERQEGVQPSDKPGTKTQFTDAEKEALTYLAKSKRVDLRWLDEEQKQKIRTVLDELHNAKKLSLLQISKEIGRSYTAIWGLCRALQIHTRNLAEAEREAAAASRYKHKRTSFDGSKEGRAYMLGFKNGDLTALQVSGTAVMVTSSTTHPAFANLFHQLFDGYGSVYQYPMYDPNAGYKWKLAARLDNSFQFLLATSEEALRRFISTRSYLLSWLAGIVDADGHVRTGESNGKARAVLAIYSTNLNFLQSVKEALANLGYHADGPYHTASNGMTTATSITYQRDFWNIMGQRTKEVQSLLRELPLRHAEKLRRKELAISIAPGTKWTEIEPKLAQLRREIHSEVTRFKQ